MRGHGSLELRLSSAVMVGVISSFVLAAILFARPSAALAGDPDVYATPGGDTAAPCTLQQPCAIEKAVESATFEQNILLGGGTYELGNESLVVDQGNLVRPAFLGEPVTIVATGGSDPTLVARDGSVLLDLTVQSASTGAAVQVDGSAGSRAERLMVDATSGNAAACQVSNGVIRDSVCHASATTEKPVAVTAASTASDSSAVTLRNVTAYADVGFGLAVGQLGDGALSLDVRNAIFQSGIPSESDVTVFDSGSGELTTDVGYSNYGIVGGTDPAGFPIGGSGTNQSSDPLFTDVASGDFSEAEGSPTIDAGTDQTTELGGLDVAGAQRIQGPAIDIGAYETTGGPADTTRPVVRITKKPPRKTRKRTATFRFTASDETTARSDLEVGCTLDARAEPPCKSPRTYRNLQPGRHRFAVFAVDEAGNFSRGGDYVFKVVKRKKRGRNK